MSVLTSSYVVSDIMCVCICDDEAVLSIVMQGIILQCGIGRMTNSVGEFVIDYESDLG